MTAVLLVVEIANDSMKTNVLLKIMQKNTSWKSIVNTLEQPHPAFTSLKSPMENPEQYLKSVES